MDLTLTTNLATAEASAITSLAEWLTTPEGQRADDSDIKLWIVEKGWHPSKWRAWAERISAKLALQDPDSKNLVLLGERLNLRLERLAFRAEDNNDVKHAIAATESQAKLNKLGGFAPANNLTQVNLNVTNATAHLVSDDALANIARQAEYSIPAEYAIPDDPLLA